MDKISYYNIEVEHGNYVMLYNTLTNSLVCLLIEEFFIVKSALRNLSKFSSDYPMLYREFKRAGFIIDKDYNELEYIKLQNKRRIFSNSDFHITINPTLDCNLNCWYCSTEYAKAIHSGGMSASTINNIIAHLKNVVEIQKSTSLHLDWFGGEPLMYFDKVIVPIASRANRLVVKNNVKFSQHATTNATLMNKDRIELMKELNFTSFQIPIDGNEQRHNKIKHFYNKGGTYKIVVNNINTIADIIPDIRITLRINYDKQTLKHIQDIVKDFSENSKRCIQVDFQRVWQVKCTEKEMCQLKDVKEVLHQNGLNSNFWAYIPQAFYRCYSDKYHHYAINYDGKIYKCTAQDYGDDKVIGNLLASGRIVWNDYLLGSLFSKATFENKRCLLCKKLPVCMGPCIQKNYNARISNTPLPCVYDYAQYSLESYVIEEAKKRNLIN